MFRITFYVVTGIWLLGFVYAMVNLATLSPIPGFILAGFSTFCLGILAIIETIKKK